MCDAFPSYGPHRTIEQAVNVEMKLGIAIAVLLACELVAVPGLRAQAPPAQSKPSDTQQPASKSQKPASQANPFPEDTTDVPVLPNGNAPSIADVPSYAHTPSALPGADIDPVRSPDDPQPDNADAQGSYYLSTKHWKAALSRFESAVVLDPENPEVYWGLGEAQRHLGKFAEARASYEKLVEYDPDSKHGKEAKKLLKDPELANAPSVSASKP